MRSRRESHGEQGTLSIETVIALPVLMVTILICMQIFLLYFARSIALAAAQEGVRAARAEHASHGSGAAVARRYASRTAGGFLTTISASTSLTDSTVRVQVHGRALSLVPFLPSFAVEAESIGAIERFTVPSGGTGHPGAQRGLAGEAGR